MIHVDTHVLVWLAAGEVPRIPPVLRALLTSSSVLVSPMVMLELGYLHEIGRVAVPATEILTTLRRNLDLGLSRAPFEAVALRALALNFTRDPFDRMIAATAMVDDLPLYTADAALRAACPVARWDEGG